MIIQSKQIEYDYFDNYMKTSHSRYHASLFQQDIMYFCKLWKSHRRCFASYCKENEILPSYLLLNQRCVDYEMSIIEYKMEQGILEQDEFRLQARQIQRIFLG